MSDNEEIKHIPQITFEDICKASCILQKKEPSPENVAIAYKKLSRILRDILNPNQDKEFFKEFGIDVR